MWYANVDPGSGWWPKLSGRGPKTYDAEGGTNPDCVLFGCTVMTDGLAVLSDSDIPLKSDMGHWVWCPPMGQYPA